jgi:hypothetical protein
MLTNVSLKRISPNFHAYHQICVSSRLSSQHFQHPQWYYLSSKRRIGWWSKAWSKWNSQDQQTEDRTTGADKPLEKQEHDSSQSVREKSYHKEGEDLRVSGVLHDDKKDLDGEKTLYATRDSPEPPHPTAQQNSMDQKQGVDAVKSLVESPAEAPSIDEGSDVNSHDGAIDNTVSVPVMEITPVGQTFQPTLENGSTSGEFQSNDFEPWANILMDSNATSTQHGSFSVDGNPNQQPDEQAISPTRMSVSEERCLQDFSLAIRYIPSDPPDQTSDVDPISDLNHDSVPRNGELPNLDDIDSKDKTPGTLSKLAAKIKKAKNLKNKEAAVNLFLKRRRKDIVKAKSLNDRSTVDLSTYLIDLAQAMMEEVRATHISNRAKKKISRQLSLEQSILERRTPEHSTPEHSDPEQSTLEQSTLEQSTLEQSTLEQSTLEQSTPEQSTPEQSTPEQSTPEQSTPEQSTPGYNILEQSVSEPPFSARDDGSSSSPRLTPADIQTVFDDYFRSNGSCSIQEAFASMQTFDSALEKDHHRQLLLLQARKNSVTPSKWKIHKRHFEAKSAQLITQKLSVEKVMILLTEEIMAGNGHHTWLQIKPRLRDLIARVDYESFGESKPSSRLSFLPLYMHAPAYHRLTRYILDSFRATFFNFGQANCPEMLMNMSVHHVESLDTMFFSRMLLRVKENSEEGVYNPNTYRLSKHKLLEPSFPLEDHLEIFRTLRNRDAHPQNESATRMKEYLPYLRVLAEKLDNGELSNRIAILEDMLDDFITSYQAEKLEAFSATVKKVDEMEAAQREGESTFLQKKQDLEKEMQELEMNYSREKNERREEIESTIKGFDNLDRQAREETGKSFTVHVTQEYLSQVGKYLGLAVQGSPPSQIPSEHDPTEDREAHIVSSRQDIATDTEGREQEVADPDNVVDMQLSVVDQIISSQTDDHLINNGKDDMQQSVSDGVKKAADTTSGFWKALKL